MDQLIVFLNAVFAFILVNAQAFQTLAGFAALIAAIVSVLKFFGVVLDDQATLWSALFNGIFLALYIGGKWVGYDLAGLDPLAANLAKLIGLILSLFGQLLVSRASYEVYKQAAKRFPVPVIKQIGYSHSGFH